MIKDKVVYTCPTIRRRTREEAYLKETLDNMLADHQEFIFKGATTHRQHTYSGGKELTLPRPTPTAREYVPRGVSLTENDYLEFEFTRGCPGCAWYRDRIGEKRPHTECRSRMVKMLETEEGRQRLSRARDRVDWYLQDHGPKDAEEAVEPTEKEEIKVEGGEIGHDAGKVQAEHEEFDMAIGSPTKLTQDVEMSENLEEGPTIVSESRHGSPTRGGDMEDSIGVEEAMVQNSEKSIGTPERAPATTRPNSSDEGMKDRQGKRMKAMEDGTKRKQAAEKEAEIRRVMKYLKTGESMPSNISLVVSEFGDVVMDDDETRIVAAGRLGVDIVEVYSPERINKVCVKYGLIPGASFDLTIGWDLSNKDDQAKAWKIVFDDKPLIIIGSPPCTLFSTLQELVKCRTIRNGKLSSRRPSRKL